MKDNKQRSFKVLVILVLAMYINETALVALNWYLGWLQCVKYGGSNDHELAIFSISAETPLTVLNLGAVVDLLVTVRLSIADSIMVFCLDFFLYSVT
jgi:hypothetical protein